MLYEFCPEARSTQFLVFNFNLHVLLNSCFQENSFFFIDIPFWEKNIMEQGKAWKTFSRQNTTMDIGNIKRMDSALKKHAVISSLEAKEEGKRNHSHSHFVSTDYGHLHILDKISDKIRPCAGFYLWNSLRYSHYRNEISKWNLIWENCI